jgi:hypothetical protein
MAARVDPAQGDRLNAAESLGNDTARNDSIYGFSAIVPRRAS